MIALFRSSGAESERVLSLLHTAAPELSIVQRSQTAAHLARISEDDRWDENETAEGIFYFASFITGNEPIPAECVEAAHELVILTKPENWTPAMPST